MLKNRFILNEDVDDDELNVATSNTQDEVIPDEPEETTEPEVDDFADDEEDDVFSKFDNKQKEKQDAETDDEKKDDNDTVTIEMYVPVATPNKLKNFRFKRAFNVITDITKIDSNKWFYLGAKSGLISDILQKNVSYLVDVYKVTYKAGKIAIPGQKSLYCDIEKLEKEFRSENEAWFSQLYNSDIRLTTIPYVDLFSEALMLQKDGVPLKTFEDSWSADGKYNDCFALQVWYNAVLVPQKRPIPDDLKGEAESLTVAYQVNLGTTQDSYKVRTSSNYNNYNLVGMLEDMFDLSTGGKLQVVQKLGDSSTEDEQNGKISGNTIVTIEGVRPFLEREGYEGIEKTIAGSLWKQYEPYKKLFNANKYPDVLSDVGKYSELNTPSLYRVVFNNGDKYAFYYSSLVTDVESNGIKNWGGQGLKFTGFVTGQTISFKNRISKEDEEYKVLAYVVPNTMVKDAPYNSTCLKLMQAFGTWPALDYYRFATKHKNIIPDDDISVEYFEKRAEKSQWVAVANMAAGPEKTATQFYLSVRAIDINTESADEYLAQYKKGSELE